MSACISPEGEYSQHIVQDDYSCKRCSIQPEDLMAWLLERAIDRLTEICDETGWFGWDVQIPAREGRPGYHGKPRVWKLDEVGNWYGDTPEAEQSQLVPVGIIATTEYNSRFEADAIVIANAMIQPVLSILEAALNDSEGSHDEPGSFGQAVTLAQAILEETSRDFSRPVVGSTPEGQKDADLR
jgi:hypothetical protein